MAKRVLFLLLSLLLTLGHTPSRAVEEGVLTIAVGGKGLFYYLPLTIAERLGYFREEGLEVAINDFSGGSVALQAVVEEAVDMAAGSFEHTVKLQAKGKSLRAVAVLGRYAGNVLGLPKDIARRYQSPKDLAGLRIGVTAPESSTQHFVSTLLAKDGLKPDAVTFVGVGTGMGAVNAMRQREIDAIANVDPIINNLEINGDIVSVVDSRHLEGQRYVYGLDYAAAVLYAREDFIQKHPATVQSAVNALVRALLWMQRATPDQIMALVPPEYYGDRKAMYRVALGKNFPAYSRDGLMSMAAAQNVHRVLRSFEPAVQQAGNRINLTRTFDNHFVIEALKKYK